MGRLIISREWKIGKNEIKGRLKLQTAFEVIPSILATACRGNVKCMP